MSFKKKVIGNLRKVGAGYVLARISDGGIDFTDVFSFNETAAFLWRELDSENASMEYLIARLCDRYSVEPATAKTDIETQLARWKELGMIE